MEAETLDQDTIDVADSIRVLYASMLTWYDRYVAKKKPGNPTPLPPVHMILFPRLFEKSWGYHRLYPQVLEDWCLYHAYLQKFCDHNGVLYPPDPEAYKLCLKQENKLKSECLSRRTVVSDDEINLSDDIQNCALQFLSSNSDGRSSIGMMAAACIAKETELIIERLRCDSYVLDPEEPPNQSTQIRKLALSYMQGPQSCSDVALLVQKAALLGITVEAHLMAENLRKGYCDYYEAHLNREIRGFALEAVTEKLDGLITVADIVASYGAHYDFRVDFVAKLEDGAEHRCWGNLVKSDAAYEGAENSEKKQLVEGVLPHGDDEKIEPMMP